MNYLYILIGVLAVLAVRNIVAVRRLARELTGTPKPNDQKDA